MAGNKIIHTLKPVKFIEAASVVHCDHKMNKSDEISEDCRCLIIKAAKMINEGKVVVFPSKCLYGLAADALNPQAVERIFQIKQRPLTNPLLVLIDDISQLDLLVKPSFKQRGIYQSGAKASLSVTANALIKEFWPGNLTIVFDAVDGLPGALTAGTGKIGIRMPGHPVARRLVRAVGRPITGTSANISGRAGCKEISLLDPDILSCVDMILDNGPLKGGTGSTVVDVTCDPVRIVREGEVSAEDIFRTVKNISVRAQVST